jgi:hypothetical protein
MPSLTQGDDPGNFIRSEHPGPSPGLRGTTDCGCGLSGEIMAPVDWNVPIIWTVFSLFAVAAAMLLYLGFFQDRSRGRPRCPRCWYNMTGAPSFVCPECGHDARSPKRLYRTRRRRWAILLSFVAVACCYYSWLVRVRVVELKEPAPVAMRPTTWLLARLHTIPSQQRYVVQARVERFGLWPWEERLLLPIFDDGLVADNGSRWQDFSLLSAAAKTSRLALDRLIQLCEHPDADVARTALTLSARHAERFRDEQLASLLNVAMGMPRRFFDTPFDAIVVEMMRRNRPGFREQISRWAANPPAYGPFKMNLEVLAAIRRMDGRPDPLHIFVDGPPVIECTTAKLPILDVAIRNVDADQEAVGFQRGGERYRHAEARCRFDIRDDRGRAVSLRLVPAAVDTSRSAYGMLGFGEAYETKLDIGQYVQSLPPGHYRVVILYHNSDRIAYAEDISNLIVFSSDPFELIVKPAGVDPRPPSRGSESLSAD